jgi:hypothetical protein
MGAIRVAKHPWRLTRRRREALGIPHDVIVNYAGLPLADPLVDPTAKYDPNAFNPVEQPREAPVNHVNFTIKETDEDIAARINERFEITETLVESSIAGDATAVIISGGPGLGKSHTVTKVLKEWDKEAERHVFVKGYARATGLVKMLYAYRQANTVLVFDDCDNLFKDELSMNILKAVCDTSESRVVSWLSEGKLVDEETGENIPRQFEFSGSTIFLTNLDLAAMAKSSHKMAAHWEALMSRGYYVDLSIKSKRDYLVRIRQVIQQGMLDGMKDYEQQDVMDFIEDNYMKLQEISIRTAIKIAKVRRNNPNNWERICKLTCCVNR